MTDSEVLRENDNLRVRGASIASADILIGACAFVGLGAIATSVGLWLLGSKVQPSTSQSKAVIELRSE